MNCPLGYSGVWGYGPTIINGKRYAEYFVTLTGPTQWTGSSGNFSTGSNWTSSEPPVGGVALFGTSGSGTVTLPSGGYSLNGLIFSNTSSSYTLTSASNADALTLTGGSTGTGQVELVSGSQTILSPLVLASNTNVTMCNPASSLSVAGSVSGPGGLALTGQGQLIITGSANTYHGGTNLNGGMLVLAMANSAGSAWARASSRWAAAHWPAARPGRDQRTGAGGQPAHTIAPGAALSSGYGTLNLIGGLITNANTTLAFNVGTPLSGGAYNGDMIIIGSGGLSIGSSTAISFAGNPTAAGDYRLFGGTIGSPTLSNFLLPTAPTGDTYSLTTTADTGYIDLAVTSSGCSPLPVGLGNSTVVRRVGLAARLDLRDGSQQRHGDVCRHGQQFHLGDAGRAAVGRGLGVHRHEHQRRLRPLEGLGDTGTLTLGTPTAAASIAVAGGDHDDQCPGDVGQQPRGQRQWGDDLRHVRQHHRQQRRLLADDERQRGWVILGGSDSYSGGTIVTAGTLAATEAAATPYDHSLTIGAGGTFIFDPLATASSLASLQAASPDTAYAAEPALRGVVAAVPEPGTVVLLLAAPLECGSLPPLSPEEGLTT